jgi:hypothetical protein
VHYQKVIQIEKIESGEAEESGNAGLQVSLFLDQFEGRVSYADAQVDSEYDRAIDEERLGENQQ